MNYSLGVMGPGEECTPEISPDFDGHTDFQKLSAEEKLLWLSQVAQFANEFKGVAKKSTNEEQD